MALRLIFNQRSISKLSSNELLNNSLSPSKINSSSVLCMSTKREATHRPNTVDKYLLVWMKKYPSVSEVPNYVTPDLMEKVRNKSRIKINIIFCFITGIVCIGMVYSGKKAAERGESVRKMNIQWHEEQNAKK